MEIDVSKQQYSFILSDHQKSLVRRNQEKIYAINAYEELRTADFEIKSDLDGKRFVQFKGIWRRIRLTIDYFDSLRFMRDEDQFKVAKGLLNPLIELIEITLRQVELNSSEYFSPIAFWTFIYYAYIESKVLCIEDVQRCFSLKENDDELSPILDDYSHDLEEYDIGRFRGVVLPSEVNRYYIDAKFMSGYEDFRVFGAKQSKKVVWLRDKTVTTELIRDELERLELWNIGFHVEQTLDRFHLFLFTDQDGLMKNMYFEIYRYWRDFIEINLSTGTFLKRLTYCLASNKRDQLSLVLGLISVTPPPRDFEAFRHKDFMTFKALVDEYVRFYSNKIEFGFFSLLRPFRAVYDRYESISSDYTRVWLKNVRLSYDGSSMPEGSYTKYALRSFLDPSVRQPYHVFENASALISIQSRREFIVDKEIIFGVRAFNASSECNKGSSLITSADLRVYREQWYKQRAKTKDMCVNGILIHQGNFQLRIPTWDRSETVLKPLVRKAVTTQMALPPLRRVIWNRSTLKLLSVLNRLDAEHEFKTDDNSTMLFCGVIDEPVISMIRQTDYKFNLLGIGKQARGTEFARSKLSNHGLGEKIDYIISDIDQSDSLDLFSVIKDLGDEIDWCLNLEPKAFVVKCQYMFPAVLSGLANLLAHVKFESCQVWKVLNSGPLGLECYLYFKPAVDANSKNVFCIEDLLLQNYLKETSFLAEQIPSVVKDPVFMSPSDTNEYIANWDYQGFTVLFNKITKNEDYRPVLNSLLSVSPKVIVQPTGTIEFPGFLAYAIVSESRCRLTKRANRMGSLNDDLYDVLPVRFNPMMVENIKPLNYGRYASADRVYNLACKMVIGKKLLDITFTDSRRSLIDIGGRLLEGMLYCPLDFSYKLIDKVNLPTFISQYDVDFVNGYVDWDQVDIDEYKYSIVTLMFVLMSGVSDIEEVRRRLRFVKEIKKRGAILVFNSYIKLSEENMKLARETAAVRLSIDGTEGTFGPYDLVPLLDIGEFSGFSTLRVTIEDVVQTCYRHGLVLSSELVNYLDVFNSFCPIMI